MFQPVFVIGLSNHSRSEADTSPGCQKLFAELSYKSAIGDIPIDESLKRARTWISRCSEDHKLCYNSSIPQLPKRVIQVDGPNIRLVETQGQLEHYVALSHCWGNSRPPCLTTKSTFATNLQRIASESLPKTFLDAVLVCKELGLRYLWIDSICIIQDDNEDWREEAGKMAAIYHQSYLTICATSARSDDEGLWPSSRKSTVGKVVIQKNGQNFEVCFRARENLDPVHMHENSGEERLKMLAMNPLMGRGWTFQERLLSTRLLHFGYGELLWQCPELQACECCFDATEKGSSDYMTESGQGVSERKSFRQMLSSPGTEVVETWRDFVMTYTELNLTFQKDMLPALSGVAKLTSTMRPGDRYLAGLWEGSLIDDLAWYTDYMRESKPRPEVYRAPSWSWASVTQSFRFSYDHYNTLCARVIRATTTLAGIDPTGEVTSGSVVLMAPVEKSTIKELLPVSKFSVRTRKGTIVIDLDASTDVEDGTVSRGNPLLCLLLHAGLEGRACFMLALVEVAGTPGIYRRVGMARDAPKFIEKLFKEETEVEIV